MPKTSTPATDLRGLSRMTTDAIVGVTDMAEAVHLNILKTTGRLGAPLHRPLSGVTSLVYRGVRGIAQLVGSVIDISLARLMPLLGKNSSWPGREAVLAALNGVLGDYLAATGNPLSIKMQLRRNGKPVTLKKVALARDIPRHNGRILVLAHGLCMNDRQWQLRGHDHGAALARDRDYTPIYLHYNTGLHISTNGRRLAELLDTLVEQWPVPVEDIAILCHSMGGLVVRSACHYGADRTWRSHLSKLVFLGTPHHGAPLERGGNWFHVFADASSYTAPLSQLGKIRSAGITDLRYGSLLDEDGEGRDRFAHAGDRRRAVELPEGVRCHAVAATIGKQPGDLGDRLLGDGLVPLDSALGRHDNLSLDLHFAPENQWTGCDMNHLDLLDRREVYEQLLKWF